MSDSDLQLWLEQYWSDHTSWRMRLRCCLSTTTSPFQQIEVHDSHAYGRLLCLAGQVALSEADGQSYAEALTHSCIAPHAKPTRLLILGGGDGMVAREALRWATLESVDVLEIDQAVIDTCHEFFPEAMTSFEDPRCRLIIDDGHRYLEHYSGAAYDCVIVDGEALHSPAVSSVHSAPLHSLIARHLDPAGIMVAPVGNPHQQAEQCRRRLLPLLSEFTEVHPFRFTAPSLGGSICAAWCSKQQHPDSLSTTPLPWLPQLDYWNPAVHVAQFQLDTKTRRALLS